jgi:hypothetical protein
MQSIDNVSVATEDGISADVGINTAPTKNNVAIFCATHVPLQLEFPSSVKVLRLGSFQAEGELNLRDLAPEWDVFHPLLGATAGSFAIRNFLKSHPEYDHVAMCSYRKFITREKIGVPVPSFPLNHGVSLEKVRQSDLSQLLDYQDCEFLVSPPLRFNEWGIANVFKQYQQDHHVEDLLRFLAEAVAEKMLEPIEVYELLNQTELIPGGAEFGVYPVYFYLNAIDRLERIVAAYLKRFRTIRDGYQLRSISFCCERVGSFILMKHLKHLHPEGVPTSYFGHIHLINS